MKTVVVPKEQVRLFNMIAIETSSLCNRTCVFCPNHTTARPDELMPWERIEHMVDQLVELKYAGCITLYLYNEPFRDKRLLDIVRYIDKRLPRACQSINTNGDYLKRPAQLEAAFAAGLRQIVLNVYSAKDGVGGPAAQARGITTAQARAAVLEGWLASMSLDKGSLYTWAPPGTRRARVDHKYGLKPDSKKIGAFELQNRSGNVAWFDNQPDILSKMCVRPFRFFNVNWRGEVVLCCNDYHGDVVLGHVDKESLVDIWNSDKFNAYRVALLAKNRDIDFCRTCDYSGGSYPHMVETVTFGSVKSDKSAMQRISTRAP